VVAETHSDHVLNGIRRAIGERRILSSEQALVHYFDIDGAKPQPLAFTENGGISSWPKGFFDQYQIDISALTRIRRPR
jgi:predicted ATPase